MYWCLKYLSNLAGIEVLRDLLGLSLLVFQVLDEMFSWHKSV